jgi:dTDP-4-dehydrorhamnose 3,5-epimerase
MEFLSTKIPGCFQVMLHEHCDDRGTLTKLFRSSRLAAHGFPVSFNESFVTRSNQGVLRGLHFQPPPHDHAKAVTCLSGSVFDVVLDLRSFSPTFKEFISFQLSGADPSLILIPRGCAHGFYVTGQHADLLYLTETEYHPESDAGVHWSSVRIQWPLLKPPILSPRDQSLPNLDDVDFLF